MTKQKQIVNIAPYMAHLPPRPVEAAAVIGPFVVHKREAKGGGYVISHVASGESIMSIMAGPREKLSLAEAKARAALAWRENPAEWAALDNMPFNAAAGDHSAIHRDALRVIAQNPIWLKGKQS